MTKIFLQDAGGQSEIPDPIDLLRKVIDSAKKLMPFDAGGIAILNEDKQSLSPIYVWVDNKPQQSPNLIEIGKGVVGTVAQTGEPLVTGNVSSLENYLDVYAGIQSEMAVPIMMGEHLLGVIDVESYQADAYDDSHLSILLALAEQAAILIGTAKLYEDLRTNYQHLQESHHEMESRNAISQIATSDLDLERALPMMAMHLTQLAKATACAITLWDSSKQRPTRLSAWGIDEEIYKSARNRPAHLPSLTKTIVETGQPIIVNNAQSLEAPPTPLIVETKADALLALPIIAHGRTIGAVFLMRIGDHTPFAKNDVEPLQTSLDQIGLGIENRQLMMETQASLRETSTLLEIASIAANIIKPLDMLTQAIEAIQTVMPIESASVLLYDRVNEMLVPQTGAIGFQQTNTLIEFPVDDEHSLMSDVFKTGLPRFVNDVAKLSENDRKYAELFELKNVLVVPLRVQFHPIGVLVVANHAHGFSGVEAGFLAAAASHIAATLRHTELLDATRARLRETEMLQHIATITSTTLDLDDMLQRTVKATADLLRTDGALLLLPDDDGQMLIPHKASVLGGLDDLIKREWPLDQGSHQVEIFLGNLSHYISNDPVSDNIIRRRNILTVALTTAQENVGVLSLINRREGPFDESHAQLATAIASHIAINMQSSRRFSEEQQRGQIMAIAHQISQELTQSLDLSGLTSKVAGLLNTEIGYEMATIVLADENEELTVHAHATDNEDLPLMQGRIIPVIGLLKEALGSKYIVIDNEISPNDSFIQSIGLTNLQSVLIAPLRRNQDVRGIVILASTSRHYFRDLDRDVMGTLGPQISSALENARLYNQAQRRLIQQGIVQQIGQDLAATLNYTELMQAIARHMARALDTSSCLVAVYSPRDEMVRIEADYRLSSAERTSIEPLLVGNLYGIEARPAMQQAIETKNIVTIYRDQKTDDDQVEKQRQVLERLSQYSQMVVPMIVGDRIIGVVDWMERRRPREFTPEDERLALILVSQASIAVENARLFRESERRASQQALLRQIAVELGKSLEPNQLFDYLTKVLVESMQAENAAFAIKTNDGRLEVRSHIAKTIDANRFVVMRDLAEDAPQIWNFLQNGYTVNVEPTINPSNYAARELRSLVQGYAGSVILTPINQRGQFLGVMEVMISLNDSLFDPQMVQMLESLADQTAIAISNVILSQREQRRLRQIERVQASGRLISSELYMPDLLNLIVAEAAEIFEIEAVSLDMLEADKRYYGIQAAHGLSDEFVAERHYSAPEFSKSEISQLRTPVYWNLDDDSDQESQLELLTHEGIVGMLNVPLVKADKVLGFLRLYHHQDHVANHSFSEQDKEIAQLLASQVTIALENANLFQELEARAVELAEANRLKSDFLATMSHELRTPMNSILGFSNTLLSGIYGNLNEKQGARIELILKNGRNLLALIDDLLDISKIEAGRMELTIERVDIRQEIFSCLQAMETQAQSKGITIDASIPETLPNVLVDSLRLKQIITNLLSNAVKFTRQGSVAIKVELKEETTLEGKHQMIWTSITDTGIGIRPEDQDIIFDEFRQADNSTTREFGGTGLGLAICRRLLLLMNGRIWVESEMGKGSTFTFTVPVAGD